jgi:hypothetical protein
MVIDEDGDGIKEFHLDAIADADPYPYWYEDADEPFSNPTLVRTETCDLCIVGGGYTGLWTAISESACTTSGQLWQDRLI